jgi:hypothetical protein
VPYLRRLVSVRNCKILLQTRQTRTISETFGNLSCSICTVPGAEEVRNLVRKTEEAVLTATVWEHVARFVDSNDAGGSTKEGIAASHPDHLHPGCHQSEQIIRILVKWEGYIAVRILWNDSLSLGIWIPNASAVGLPVLESASGEWAVRKETIQAHSEGHSHTTSKNAIGHFQLLLLILLRVTGWKAEFRFPARKRDFCLLHDVQSGSGTHPTSYPLGSG